MKLKDRKMLVPIAANILKYFEENSPKGTENYIISKFNINYEIESRQFPQSKLSFDINLLDVVNHEHLHPLSEEEQIQFSEQIPS